MEAAHQIESFTAKETFQDESLEDRKTEKHKDRRTDRQKDNFQDEPFEAFHSGVSLNVFVPTSKTFFSAGNQEKFFLTERDRRTERQKDRKTDRETVTFYVIFKEKHSPKEIPLTV
jgi:hypothetical protein